jgi:hypothetical protein
METFLQNLKRQAEENPIAALAVGAAVLTTITKLLGTSVDVKNSRAWAQEVARRTMKDSLPK